MAYSVLFAARFLNDGTINLDFLGIWIEIEDNDDRTPKGDVMATLYFWLFIFGGATLVLLGIFLFGSERNLGKQRRRADELRRQPQFSGARGSEIPSLAESMTTNEELVEKISSLSSRLEERERRVEELRSEQRQLASVRYDNHELQGKIGNLTKQLHTHEWRLSESAREIQQIGQRNSHLQNEVTDLKQQLQASQTASREFEAEGQRLLDQLQTTEANLAATASQYKKVMDHASQLHSELAATKPQIDQLRIRNKELLGEIDSLSSKFAASERAVEELRTIRHGVQSENQELRAVNQDLQQEIANLKAQLQASETRLSDLASQAEEMADLNSKLQTEIIELIGQVQASRETIEELQTEQLRVLDQLQKSESALGATVSQYNEIADQYAKLQFGLAEQTRRTDELTNQNNVLAEEMNALSEQLATSQKAVQALRTLQNETNSENRQLGAANQGFQQAIATLANQLRTSESKLSESAQQIRQITDGNAKLQSEVNELKQQLQKTTEDLETGQERLLHSQSENQRLSAANRNLEEEIASLYREVQTAESLLATTTSQYDEIAGRHSRLQSEFARLREDSDQLMLNHKEEIISLSTKLAARQKTVAELETARDRLGATQAENEELRAVNLELRDEITIVKDRLQTSEGRASEAAAQNLHSAERYAALQTELAELTRRAEESEKTTRELEAVREQLAEAESREMILRTRQEQLQAQLAMVERELAADKEALNATYARLVEMDNACQGLAGENRRLTDLSQQWQERHALGDESEKHQPQNEPARPVAWSWGERKWPFGIIPARAAAAILGGIALGFVGISFNKFFGSKEAGAPDSAYDQEVTRVQGASDTPQGRAPSVAAAKKTEVDKQTAEAGSASSLKGAFKTIQATELFTGPSEDSALIATIRPGTKITVVDSHRGWLQIHAGQSRRSGFVRQESAVRID